MLNQPHGTAYDVGVMLPAPHGTPSVALSGTVNALTDDRHERSGVGTSLTVCPAQFRLSSHDLFYHLLRTPHRPTGRAYRYQDVSVEGQSVTGLAVARA